MTYLREVSSNYTSSNTLNPTSSNYPNTILGAFEYVAILAILSFGFAIINAGVPLIAVIFTSMEGCIKNRFSVQAEVILFEEKKENYQIDNCNIGQYSLIESNENV